MALQVAIKVRAWVITSSSLSTPTRSMAIWSALVPFTHTTAFCVRVYSITISSKRSTNLPTLDTNVLSIHSFRYFFSFPLNIGLCKGIKSFVPYILCIKSIVLLNSLIISSVVFIKILFGKYSNQKINSINCFLFKYFSNCTKNQLFFIAIYCMIVSCKRINK